MRWFHGVLTAALAVGCRASSPARVDPSRDGSSSGSQQANGAAVAREPSRENASTDDGPPAACRRSLPPGTPLRAASVDLDALVRGGCPAIELTATDAARLAWAVPDIPSKSVETDWIFVALDSLRPAPLFGWEHRVASEAHGTEAVARSMLPDLDFPAIVASLEQHCAGNACPALVLQAAPSRPVADLVAVVRALGAGVVQTLWVLPEATGDVRKDASVARLFGLSVSSVVLPEDGVKSALAGVHQALGRCPSSPGAAGVSGLLALRVFVLGGSVFPVPFEAAGTLGEPVRTCVLDAYRSASFPVSHAGIAVVEETVFIEPGRATARSGASWDGGAF